MSRTSLIEVAANNLENYTYLFQDFGHFENLLRFIIKYTEYVIKVNDLKEPSCAILKYGPAIFVKGDPNSPNIQMVLDHFQENNWIVPCTTNWDNYIKSNFKDKFEIHNRIQFDSESLELEHVRSLKVNLPDGINIVPINTSHIEDRDGMIYQDLIRKFFGNHDFLKSGIGFALMYEKQTVGYVASDNPIIGNDVELMFRVGYDNYTKYRGKGYGVQLCVRFIEYCLTNNLIPSWDAHTDISAHIAVKLGYTMKKKWNMFHIL